MRVVAITKPRFGHLDNTSNAFCHVLAGHLEMNTARVGPDFVMCIKEPLDLGHDVTDTACLVAAAGLDGVAMHRITAPDDLRAG